MKNDQIDLREKITASIQAGGEKILFANIPADGHFNPIKVLAKHLQTASYDPCKLCEQYVTELLGPETKNSRITYILN